MFIRTKNGSAHVENRDALLEFLRGEERQGIGNREQGTENRGWEGRIRVRGDIEVIAAVPFALAVGEGNGGGNAGDGDTPYRAPWTFSTFDLDRFDERIDPAGWDFQQYLKNPVIEWAHRYDIPAIGRAEGIYADEKGLHGTVIFNDKEYDPFGWGIGERVKNGVIRAGSVGFRVIEIEIPDKETAKDGTTLIFRKQEFLEFSICNVPANPFALAKTMIEAKTDTTQDLGFPGFWGNVIHNFEGV